MKVIKRYGENYENRMNDIYKAKIEDLSAKLAYLSMMTSIDIPEEENDAEEKTNTDLV